MKDTQWPRYQVFLQERPGAPYQDVGSVHAPDVELALLNARDVFVRRPECAGLWVLPANAITTCTAEEIEDGRYRPAAAETPLTGAESVVEIYEVFCKSKSAGTHVWAGQVQTGSPSRALQQAIEQYSGQKVYSWWVFPQRRVVSSNPMDTGAWFEPAHNKPYRLSSDFRTVSAMREIRKG